MAIEYYYYLSARRIIYTWQLKKYLISSICPCLIFYKSPIHICMYLVFHQIVFLVRFAGIIRNNCNNKDQN